MTQITGTNREFLQILKALESVKTLKGKTFALLVAKNISSITEHLQPIEKASIPSKDFQELSVKVHKLIEEEKSEEIEKIESEHVEIIEERKHQLDNVEKMLNMESSVGVNLISEEHLPSDITADQIYGLLKILK
jgi:hypothetical protein